MTSSPGILLILDGWGEGPAEAGNAITAAVTPTLDRLRATYPSTLLAASGTAVGLPEGVVGNSEIGHLVMGCGRALEYDSLLVQQESDSGRLRRSPALLAAGTAAAGNGKAMHIVGLCSDGRIHADLAHTRELLQAAVAAGLETVWLHAITDGRDVGNGTARQYLGTLQGIADEVGAGRIASVIGRNYAMDKSGDAALTTAACRLVVDGIGAAVGDWREIEGDDDGWIPPTVVPPQHGSQPGSPVTIQDGDVVVFANFRSDRISGLVDAIATSLNGSDRDKVALLSLAQYDTAEPVTALVPRADAGGGLADFFEATGVRTVRVAEREKFEHVTFFFNGRDPSQRPGEEQICIPSRAEGDYLARPGMNLDRVCRQIGVAAARDDVDLVVANLANMDVVGHTGHFEATVAATEAVDQALHRLLADTSASGRWILLVGDHGNAETMTRTTATGAAAPYGGHTTNPVPCVLIHPSGAEISLLPGALPSVAPTVVELLGLPVPAAMTAPSLLRGKTS